jgi:hypothetical protein
MVGDRPVGTTDRFWTSLYARFGFNKSIFNYFDPAEVFERVSSVRPDDKLRFTYQTNEGTKMPSLLAVSNPTKSIIPMDDAMELLSGYKPMTDISFADGQLRSTFAPRGEAPFEIGGDAFEARFDTLVPIDGYGSAQTILGTLRVVCTNGMVAFSKAFSNKIPGGTDSDGGLSRIEQVIQSYGNDEGFDALRRRLDSATTSYASVAECNQMSIAIMHSLGANGGKGEESTRDVLDRFDRMTGNFISMYGLVSANTMGRKRLASLPSRCTSYDLMNFGTEVATHKVENETRRRGIQGVVGSMLAGEYDLEGSAAGGQDFVTVFLERDKAEATKTTNRLDELENQNPELN